MAPKQTELPVQGLQGEDIAAQRYHTGELETVLYGPVQDHIPIGHYQEGVLEKGDTAPAGGKTLRALLGHGHKLRKAMGQRDDRYTLEGMIEAGEGYFTIGASAKGHATQKKGRGSKTKAKVMLMAENTDTGKVGRRCRYFKAKVLKDHKMEGTDRTLQKAIDNEESIALTDKSTSYVNIAGYVDIRISERPDEKTTKETLKRVHIAIGDAKRNFVGTYHETKAKYLQLYLNEFVYKLNRRYFAIDYSTDWYS